MIVSREWLDAHSTGATYWTNAQLAALGVAREPGWTKAVVGREIPEYMRVEFERIGAAKRAKMRAKRRRK